MRLPFGKPAWKSIAEDKQATQEQILRLEKSTEPDIQYLRASAPEIVENIRTKRWTASKVLEAYIAQAIIAHKALNCLTEILFEEARRDADALDQLFHKTGLLKGPLHGVPVSVKDQFDIAGYDSTVGNSGDALHPAEADAELVKLIRAAGGVIFVKTNVPQTMTTFETVNPVWGRTKNPVSQAHTCGGSSGGEGALLAADGSALGWGCDIGGSLRIPASYCGIYCLKPGSGRICNIGTRDAIPGFFGVPNVSGPFGRTVADVELGARVAFGGGVPDYSSAPLPYRDIKLPQKLKFGYYISDDFVRPSPVCERAVWKTVEALRSAGHECIEIPSPETSKSLELFTSMITSDGNKTLLAAVGDDPQQVEINSVTIGPKLPGWIRPLLAWIAKSVLGDIYTARMVHISKRKTVAEYWRTVNEARQLARRVNREARINRTRAMVIVTHSADRCGKNDNYPISIRCHRTDGIIGPVQAMPALPHKAVANVAALSGSTVFYNILDIPVGVVPVTQVDPKTDHLSPEWHARKTEFGQTSTILEKFLYQGLGGEAIYNADKMAGLPVGVQIVGGKWQEEKVIEMMKVVDVALGPRGPALGSWGTAMVALR